LRAGWIHDLNRDAPAAPIKTDVCILGAGPVGLTLACALAQRGLSVTILEKGASTPCPATESPDVRFDRRAYRGATIGRALGLGGTSALWGGQLLPVRPADLLSRPQINALAWPITYAQIQPYFGALQEMLGVNTAGFDLASTRGAAHALSSLDFTDWSPRLSKWLAFGKRNMAVALNSHLTRNNGIQVWLNASVQGCDLAEVGGKRMVRELVANSAQGNTLRVHPRSLVIAGGALEAARSVLELNSQAGSLSEGVSEFAGRFLHDHLSLQIARVTILDEVGFEERFSPFFEGPTMRSLRMELPPETLEGAGLPALYAHFIAHAPATSGFAVVRDCLRAVQRRDLRLALGSAARVPRALPGIARIVYSRVVKHRLAFPTDSRFFLQIDLEQAPKYENRVYLGQSQEARPQLHIDWDVDEDAPRIARSVQHYFERFWDRNALNQVARLDFLDPSDDAQAWNSNVHDLYHPAGTTRMAADPTEGVVDENLRIHGTGNVYVAGSSVFPSLGAANPTFTAMALALRMAHFIDQTR
jgi:choline dehydrogenase-like flavoprotein